MKLKLTVLFSPAFLFSKAAAVPKVTTSPLTMLLAAMVTVVAVLPSYSLPAALTELIASSRGSMFAVVEPDSFANA